MTVISIFTITCIDYWRKQIWCFPIQLWNWLVLILLQYLIMISPLSHCLQVKLLCDHDDNKFLSCKLLPFGLQTLVVPIKYHIGHILHFIKKQNMNKLFIIVDILLKNKMWKKNKWISKLFFIVNILLKNKMWKKPDEFQN